MYRCIVKNQNPRDVFEGLLLLTSGKQKQCEQAISLSYKILTFSLEAILANLNSLVSLLTG